MTVSFQGTVFIRLNFKMYAINFSCLFPYIHSRHCAVTCIPYGGAILRLTLDFFSSLFMSHAVFLLTGLNSPLGAFGFSHFSEIFLSPLYECAGIGDLNSGPHICTGNALSHEAIFPAQIPPFSCTKYFVHIVCEDCRSHCLLG